MRDGISAVAQQLNEIAVPGGSAIVQFERFAGALCGAHGTFQSGRMDHVALPFTGGSAIGLSATDAWHGPLPVMVVNVTHGMVFGEMRRPENQIRNGRLGDRLEFCHAGDGEPS